MYTECPKCSVIFSMSEEDLKSHHGLVRCGRCAEVFNASWNVVDKLPDQPRSGRTRDKHEVRDADTSPAVEMEDDAPDSSFRGGRVLALGDGPESRLEAQSPGGGSEATIEQEQPDFTIPKRVATNDATDRGRADEQRPPDRPRGAAADEPVGVTDAGEETTEAATPSWQSFQQAAPPEAWSGREQTRAAQEPPQAMDAGRQGSRERSGEGAAGSRPDTPKPAIKAKLGKVPDAPVVDEEIIIEAPLNLWAPDDEEATVDTVTVERVEDPAEPLLAAKAAGAGGVGVEAPASPSTAAGVGPASSERKPKRAPVSPTANDVRMVEIPYPRPIKTMAWTLAVLLLLLAIVWQAREYYISDLAKVPFVRGYLEVFCDYAACTVPPRTDIKSIDLLGTSVDPHPVAPGALRISANLVNRAAFAQPFPPLEITLTDKEGIVIGRRTYLPHEYLGSAQERMAPNVVRRVDIDLAQPADSAVGYEIQLVAR